MRGKSVLKILVGFILLVILIKLFTGFYLESLVKDKIQSALNKKSNKYTIKIDKINFLYLRAGIEVESIAVYTDPSFEAYGDLNSKISQVKITGIHLIRALFHHDYHFKRLIISQPFIVGRIPSQPM